MLKNVLNIACLDKNLNINEQQNNLSIVDKNIVINYNSVCMEIRSALISK